MLTLCRVTAVSSRASCPAYRSSTTWTSSPLGSMASVRCERRNPAPPATSTRIVVDPSTEEDDGDRAGDGAAPALGPATPGCQLVPSCRRTWVLRACLPGDESAHVEAGGGALWPREGARASDNSQPH